MPKKDNHFYQPLPHQTYRKSLDSFKAGLNNPEPKRNKTSLIAFTATGMGLAIAGALFLSFYPFSSIPDQPSGEQIPAEINPENEVDQTTLEEMDENEALIEELFLRDALMPDASQSHLIHNDEFQIMLPDQMHNRVSEKQIQSGTKTTLTGADTEIISLFLFDKDTPDDYVATFTDDLLSEHHFTETTTVPINRVTEQVESMGGGFFNDHLFTESETSIYAMKNEETDRFYELYKMDLFGKQLILFGDYPLNQPDSKLVSYFTLGNLSPAETPYLLNEGEIDPTSGLPRTKEMLLREGALPRYDSITFQLTEIDGLPFTPYLVEDASPEKINHDGFTEWRIRENETSESSFYSIGKMDPSFDISQSEEILMNGFDVDLAHLEDIDGLATNENFAYYDTVEQKSGSFLLYSYEDEWYFTYDQSTGDGGAREGSFYDKRIILSQAID